jgi:hypothetical protein
LQRHFQQGATRIKGLMPEVLVRPTVIASSILLTVDIRNDVSGWEIGIDDIRKFLRDSDYSPG